MGQNNASSVTSGRPWQATFLGVLDVIATVIVFLFGILFFFMQGFISSFLDSGFLEGAEGVDAAEAAGMMSFLGGLGAAVGVIFLGLGVLYIFMARGAFKGQKWSPILSVVFGALAVLSSLMNFSTSQILGLVINLFVIYLAVMCVKSPYFAKK